MAAENSGIAGLLFLFYLLASQVSSQAPSIREQKQILLQIKRDWGDEPALASWNDTTSSSHCAWPGVGCAAGGAVVNLSLSGFTGPKISRPIPASALCRLPNITLLDLSFNDIPGGFPTGLFLCSGLRYLDLSQNRFVGALPSDVDRLSHRLTHLDLSSNNFSGGVPEAIGRLPAMQELLLNSNLFDGSFPQAIGNLSELRLLTLAYNPFSPARIPPEFGNLTKLQVLVMTDMNLQGEIPESFGKLMELVHLDLAYNELTGAIPAGIWSLPKLQLLYLYNNNLSSSIVIEGEIRALDLEKLDVSGNQLNGSIPEEFGKLQSLSILHMSFNQFTGDIPASIGRLPSLTDLRLFNNILTGAMPLELGKHSPLWNVEVNNNMLSGELPDGLCDGGGFTSIVVFNNNLTGRIPATLGECSTLDNFQIYNNQFSGEVPEGIWLAESMTTMMMSDNALSGQLPERLPLFLSRLEIRNNKFTGRIPSIAGNLSVFSASNNMFSGDLPSSLAGLSRLQSIDLGGNMITGRIPENLSLLASLFLLNLSNNRLAGEIPASIGSLPVLNSLDLSQNDLTGEIPQEMGNLNLNYLNLSSNKLSGEVPARLQSSAYDKSFLSNPGLCASNSRIDVAACSSASRGSSGGLSRGLLALFIVVGALALLMAFSVFLHWDLKKRRGDGDTWKLISFHSLDFRESNIRSGINEENLIGSGGAGKVYKITVGHRTDEIVAVKKIRSGKKLDAALEKQFESEVQILGSIRHKNIVKLLCCISGEDSKLLVYEYMENGSLDRWLHRKPSSPAAGGGLDWPTRLEIAIGAARGLCYMHHDCSPPIIHRDVKSSNILLDSEFNARVADFGLARMMAKAGEQGLVSAIAGTFGYMAPECGHSSRIDEKVDIYSFGVILLELTTGREAQDGGGDEQCNLAEWAWRRLLRGDCLRDALDPRIKESPSVEDMTMVLQLGIMCTTRLPSRRPSMNEVLHFLLQCYRPTAGVKYDPCAEQDAAAPLLSDGSADANLASNV
ncbi:receptor-like protein kinase HSL1 [Zingiber officinale]|uniref:receptor-like protein kinase HSL1 n=1 Tax=Zingiber officinale TaxID=94328 RepID=UPI001C4A7B4C|nr:receptor-like protein kinase HSL1 [Zingiber officinale]